MSSRLLIGLVVVVSLAFAAPAQAAPGALNVLVTGNQSGTPEELATAIAAEPGVASATFFDTDTATPAAASLAAYDLIVSIGDSDYFDAALWGDRLADYVDAGGAVLQTAYDNWEDTGAAPTGRFESGGYAPLLNGDNENLTLTLGTLVVPDHPLVQGLGTFPTGNNTNTPLAPGATLLAQWSNGYNAIAFKNRVASVSASPGDAPSIPGIAHLARNTGNFLGRHNVTVTKTGTGFGTVTSTPAGITCGGSCTSLLPFGATLVASAIPDSRFVGWTGACTGVGSCDPTITGPNLSVGAVFDRASFGSDPLVTLSLVSTKVPKSGKFKIYLANGNDFSVSGALSARKVKSNTFFTRAKGTSKLQLKLPKSLKKVLAKKGKLKIVVIAKLKDPAGNLRTVKKRLTLKRKR